MRRALQSLVSHCLEASQTSYGQLHGAAGAAQGVLESSHALFNAASRSLSTASSGALARTATSGSSATCPAASVAPRSCWWLMQLAQAPQRCCPLPDVAARHYAKATKGGGGGGGGAAPAAGAAPTGPKRHRTSSTKLYSCRNDRLRHTHEQIWPTLQLTEAEAAMFKKNSRLFVVDMGRSMSLETKFRMGSYKPTAAAEAAKAAASAAELGVAQAEAKSAAITARARKVPYHQARALLHEAQLHLDALGENPRYLRIRRVSSLYATKLQNVRKLRLLLGFQRRRFVQTMYETSLAAHGPHRMWKMVCAMEAKLPVFATRMGMAEDVVGARRAVRDGKVYVNGRRPDMPYAGYLTPGDVVGPGAGSVPHLRQRVMRSMAPLEGEIIRAML